MRQRCFLDILRRGVVERCHDDQDAVGAVGARFDHLVGVVHEILAQHRQAGGRAGRHHEIEMALKRRRVGQHRKTRSAAGFIGACKCRRVEVGADQALRGRSLLYFGDQRVFAVGQLCADRPDKTARRGCSLRQRFDAGERVRAFGGGDLFALVGFDLGQDIGHDSFPRSAVGDRD